MAKVLSVPTGTQPNTMGHPHHLQTQLTKSLERILEEAHLSGELKLSGRKLKDFPRTGGKYDLTDTVVADLSKNRFWELPSEVLEFLFVEKLHLYHNSLRTLPEGLGCLQSLKFLDLSRNQLSSLPGGLCHLQSLEVLLVANNKLAVLPDDIGNLKNLMELDMSCNEITHLPRTLGRLKNLKVLALRNNLLHELPIELTYLKLSSLDMSNNRLSSLPIELRQMSSLETLRLSGNPLVSPPAVLVARGRVHVFKYLETQAGKSERRPPGGTLRKTAVPELRAKRQTVDSGYSTSDGVDVKWSSDYRVIDEGSTRLKTTATGDNHIPVSNGVGGEVNGEATAPSEELSRSALALDQLEAKRLILLQSNDRAPLTRRVTNGNAPHCNEKTISEERRSLEHIQTYREYKEALRLQRAAQPQDVYRPKGEGPPTPNSPSPCEGEKPVQKVTPTTRPAVNGDSPSYVKPTSPLPKTAPQAPCKGARQTSPRTTKWAAEVPADKLSFTMRREFERAKEEAELMDQLRHNIESRLRVSLPEDLGPALMDGVVLCHLANHVRPRSVGSIHVPSPAVPKLSMARCRRNVDNFLEACRRIGVEEGDCCTVADVVESLDVAAVLRTVSRLTGATTASPRTDKLRPPAADRDRWPSFNNDTGQCLPEENVLCCAADVLEGRGLVQVSITVTELLKFHSPRSPARTVN